MTKLRRKFVAQSKIYSHDIPLLCEEGSKIAYLIFEVRICHVLQSAPACGYPTRRRLIASEPLSRSYPEPREPASLTVIEWSSPTELLKFCPTWNSHRRVRVQLFPMKMWLRPQPY